MVFEVNVPSNTCDAGGLGPGLAELCSGSSFLTFMTILEVFVRAQNKISGICERVVPVEEPDDEYDFVVIGGGGSGAPAASRLSEIEEWKVLVLEGGPDEPMGAEIPAFYFRLAGTSVDWKYKVTNESHACLSTNGTCALSSAKMLGGSTSHNGMIYLRGVAKDYDNWAASGNEGWTWEEVEPFYKKGEDNGEIERVGRKHHGTGGPLHVERFPYLNPFAKSVYDASVQAGYGTSEDLNGDTVLGAAINQATSKNGVRCSSAAAYLRPVRNRKNLDVSLNSTVTRIVVENGRAVGVEYYKNGQLKTVRAKKEIVVSAGSVRSPHLLLLSGIGPKEELESVGIEVVKELPGVGSNSHNHPSFVMAFTINDTDTYDNDWAAAMEYLTWQTGPMSGTGVSEVMTNLATNMTTSDYPDIQLYFSGFDASCAPGGVNALRSNGLRTVSLHVVNYHPKSRGRVSLASKDPLEYPTIWMNYLGESEDVDRLVEGIKLALALAETEAMKSNNFTLSATPVAACSDYKFATTEYWRCAVHQSAQPEHHHVGTCKMGPKTDPMAVVDPRLRVYGIKGLRVADASIMPMVNSGHTAAPSMMIGERVADFIKKDWAKVKSSKKRSSKNTNKSS